MNPEGCKAENCGNCPLADAAIERAGLLWIGEQFYKTPEDWAKEANDMGISRRIQSVPRGFKLGETWVAVAHIKAIPGDKPKPGIFRLFKPTVIEYVVTGKETEEALENLVKRGITPIKVEHDVPAKYVETEML